MYNTGYTVSSTQVAYKWNWENATERQNTIVGASSIGFVGYQTDMAQSYKLLSISPNRWGVVPDESMGLIRYITACDNSLFTRDSVPQFIASGTQTPRLANNTNAANRLTRFGVLTLVAAGSISVFRTNTLSGFSTIGGCRFRTQFTLGNVSSSMRWFSGFSNTVPATNVNPNTFLSSFGVGRGDSEANVQLFHNDSVGVGSQIDLGGDFPANTADSAYEFEFYTFDSTSFSYQLTNLTSLIALSGTIALDVPAAVYPSVAPLYYSTNNIDVAQVSLDFANCQFWQRVV